MKRIIMKLFAILAVALSILCVQPVFGDPSTEPISITSPPSDLPVTVSTSFYLWDLYNIDEKNGTFSADIYLTLKWEDQRLAFQDGKAPIIYSEKSAMDKLKLIWWPQLDYVNATKVDIKNISLAIYPDGQVLYSTKISATFFADMDLRKFPFDQQFFTMHIESFLWDTKTVQFTANAEDSGFQKAPHFEGLRFVDLNVEIGTKEFPYMAGEYSDFAATVHLKRSAGFFLYQILIPVLIVMGLTCCMFYLNVEDLKDRLIIGQGCILVLVAMKFMINQELPQIDYLTLVDYIFFFAYLCSAISIALSVIDYILWKKKNPISEKVNRKVIWIPLILFLLLYVLLLYLAKVI